MSYFQDGVVNIKCTKIVGDVTVRYKVREHCVLFNDCYRIVFSIHGNAVISSKITNYG